MTDSGGSDVTEHGADIVERLMGVQSAERPQEWERLKAAGAVGTATEHRVGPVVEWLLAEGEQQRLGNLEGSRIEPKVTLSRPIGRGGMVYKGQQENPDRPVAVKIVSGLWLSAATHDRFLREAAALADLGSDGIPQVYAQGTLTEPEEAAGRPYFVMQFVDGTPLDVHVRDCKRSVRETLELVARIADILGRAHARGVLHLDLKPSNILVDRAGAPWVIDFGLASGLQAPAPLLSGTLPYLAPEHLVNGLGSTSPQTDVFSLGLCLVEVLTGKLPYRAAGPGEEEAKRAMFDAMTDGGVRVPDAVPAAVRAIVRRCLRKSPDERYSRAADLAADLRKAARQRPRMLMTAGVAAVVLGGMAAMLNVAGLWRWRAAASFDPQSLPARDTISASTAVLNSRRASSVVVPGMGLIYPPRTDDDERTLRQAEADGKKHGALRPQIEATIARGNGEQALDLLKQWDQYARLDDAEEVFARHLLRGDAFALTEQPAEAEQSYRRALTLQPQSIDAKRGLASALFSRGIGLYEAEDLMQQVVDAEKERYGPAHDDMAGVYLTLAMFKTMVGKPRDVATLRTMASDIIDRRASSPKPIDPLLHCMLATSWLESENSKNATVQIRAAEESLKRFAGTADPFWTVVNAVRVKLLLRVGELESAKSLLAALSSRDTERDPSGIRESLLSCEAVVALGEHGAAAAIPIVNEVIAVIRAREGPDSINVAITQATVAAMQMAAGLHEQAQRSQLDAIEIVRREFGDRHPLLVSMYASLAMILLDRLQPADALPWAQKAIDLGRDAYGEGAPELATSYERLGCALQATGDINGARDALQRSLEIAERNDGTASITYARRLDLLSSLLCQSREYQRAYELNERSILVLKNLLGPDSPLLAPRYCNQNAIFSGLGKPLEAERAILESIRLVQVSYGDEHPQLGPYYVTLGIDQLNRASPKEAEVSLRKGISLLTKHAGAAFMGKGTYLLSLAAAVEDQERWSEAAQLIADALGVDDSTHELSPQVRAAASLRRESLLRK